jgi:hypothetical protein
MTPIFKAHVVLAAFFIAAGPIQDDWGPITAAVLSFIVLAGLIMYGSTHFTDTKSLTATALHKTISPSP